MKKTAGHTRLKGTHQKITQLEKRLDIATKALKKLTRNCNKWEIAREALKEMKGVK